jgi:radical SAM protein with 4Fe4S-binding SPASM domain
MNDSSKYLHKELIRPNWNCGRYYKIDDNRYALLYNLLEGMAYFFEQESADIIGIILRFPKNGLIPLQALFESVPSNISKDEVIDFCNELISVGLLTDGFLTNEAINHNRRIIGDNRCKSAMEIDRTIQERLPFQQNEAEDIYMDIIEKYRVPFVVMFELTYSCNEKCVHCFNPGAARNDSEHSTRSNRDEINIIHYEKLLNELQQMGVVKIILTGGDPFVKKDIWRLIEMIYERDFALDIYTNGIGLIGRVEKLAKYFPRSIGLSVYSATDEVHDSITRVNGSLKKTLSVAQDLVKFGVPLYFKCPIMNHNATSYYTIVELAKQFGATPQIDITLTDSVDGDTAITDQLQVDGELLEIILRDPNIPLYVGKEAPNYGRQEKDKSKSFCGAGTVLMNITPEGDVTPCNSFPTQFGNLKEKSFSEIWNNSKSLNIWQHTVIGDYDECGTHERCGFCNRCPGQSFVEHGTPLKASTANCNIANARMNLAKKLIRGNDPLNGESTENVLQKYIAKPVKQIVSNKHEINYRNQDLTLTKNIANS